MDGVGAFLLFQENGTRQTMVLEEWMLFVGSTVQESLFPLQGFCIYLETNLERKIDENGCSYFERILLIAAYIFF
jgi:hypothetical protein